jgi:nucleotide-binding universal stress UspA family protein
MVKAFKRVLVAVAFDDVSEATLICGRSLAMAFGAELHVLHVAENLFLRPMSNDPDSVEDGVLEQVQSRLTEIDRTTLRAKAAVRQSTEPAEEIVRYARDEDIDLIVVGTHGSGAIAHLLMGSVAESVIRTAPCPVTTVRHA